MELTESTKQLLIDLETIIGNEAYNPHSYDGYTGEEGCAFRYPVSIPIGEEDDGKTIFTKIKSEYEYSRNIELGITLDQLSTMRYRFGDNELWIGYGIINLLTKLENIYNLDFDKLENEYQSKHNL